MRLKLEGDTVKAGQWIGFAKARLRILKEMMSVFSRSLRLCDGIEIYLASAMGHDSIRIIAEAEDYMIICHTGATTGEYGKKYFDIYGKNTLPAGWALVDDGQYGIIWTGVPSDDPYSFAYGFQRNGLNIAPTSSGIPAKKQAGKAARFILCQAVEDERYIARRQTISWPGPVPPAFSYSYNYLQQVDSLTFAPYKQYGNKPFMHRYFVKLDDQGHVEEEGVLSLHIVWAGSLANLYYEGYIDENFRDTLPAVPRIYKTLMDGTRTYRGVVSWNDRQVLIAAVQRSTSKDVVLLRVKTQVDAGENNGEPIRQETYNMATMADPTVGNSYHRCSDPMSELCYMTSAVGISGKTYDGNGFVTNTGQSTIANDIKILFGVKDDGAKTYVRMEKDTEFTIHKCGLYVADQLIVESGFQAVTLLYDQDPIGTPGRKLWEEPGPLQIRQTGYKILHAYHDNQFDACIYEKVIHQSHSSDLLPYLVNRNLPAPVGSVDCQVRRTLVVSKTTYHIAVNGMVMDLPYECVNREYTLTVLSEQYVGAPLPKIAGYHDVVGGCVDVGYDINGTVVAGENNKNVTRIFTDATAGLLIVSLDAFPVKYRHNLILDVHNILRPEYDTAVAPDPPSSDGTYPAVSDRKWLVFTQNGSLLRELTPPQVVVGDVPQHVGRVNGLCMVRG